MMFRWSRVIGPNRDEESETKISCPEPDLRKAKEDLKLMRCVGDATLAEILEAKRIKLARLIGQYHEVAAKRQKVASECMALSQVVKEEESE